MGMLPTGTANDQGKSFGLAAGAGALADNVAVIAGGRVTAIDAGRIEVIAGEARVIHRDLFFDSASVGFGADALVARNRDRELVGKIPLAGFFYRDMLVYAGAVVRKFAESYVSDVKFDLASRSTARATASTRCSTSSSRTRRCSAASGCSIPRPAPTTGCSS
jgi:hypothetical protein